MTVLGASARVETLFPALPDGIGADGTRGRILASGLELFARTGYHGTSIRDIAASVGVRTSSLYEYFPTKAHLLAELIFLGHREHHRQLRAALLGSQPEPIEQMRQLVRAHVRLHAEYAMLATVANNELHALDPPLAAPALALREQSAGLILDAVQRGVQLGCFSPPHAWVAAAAIGSMGLRVAAWYRPDFELSIAQLADVYAEMAVRMLVGGALA